MPAAAISRMRNCSFERPVRLPEQGKATSFRVYGSEFDQRHARVWSRITPYSTIIATTADPSGNSAKPSAARVRTQRGNLVDKGYLYKLLNNPSYLGLAVHKGTAYPREHAAIIPQDWPEQESARLYSVDRWGFLPQPKKNPSPKEPIAPARIGERTAKIQFRAST